MNIVIELKEDVTLKELEKVEEFLKINLNLLFCDVVKSITV